MWVLGSDRQGPPEVAMAGTASDIDQADGAVLTPGEVP